MSAAGEAQARRARRRAIAHAADRAAVHAGSNEGEAASA
jgi:hypothetical protein